jgi:transcriptional regulator with XRE-family HTH domain
VGIDNYRVASTIHSDEYRVLLVLLRQARERSGLRQSELADRLGRTQSWVSKVEMGERRLDLEELRQVCVAVDADLVKMIRRWLRDLESAGIPEPAALCGRG